MTQETIINQLETIDSKLESLNSQSLLLVGNTLCWSNDVNVGEIAEILGQIASLPKSLQETVLDSIYAKVKAR
jgi:hypothetical protein